VRSFDYFIKQQMFRFHESTWLREYNDWRKYNDSHVVNATIVNYMKISHFTTLRLRRREICGRCYNLFCCFRCLSCSERDEQDRKSRVLLRKTFRNSPRSFPGAAVFHCCWYSYIMEKSLSCKTELFTSLFYRTRKELVSFRNNWQNH